MGPIKLLLYLLYIENCFNDSGFPHDIFKNLQNYIWPDPDLILIDPPRKGLEPKTIDLISQTTAKVLVYVSCNLKTFANDAKLLEEYGYKLNQLTPVDQFPHTKHLEIVSVFTQDPK